MGDKLFVHIIKIEKGSYILAGLSEDKQLWFSLPPEHQDLKQHTKLLSMGSMKNAIKSIQPIGGYRKIAVTIDNELKKLYYDEDGNVCYNTLPLEEIIEEVPASGVVQDETVTGDFFFQKIKQLEAKLNSNDETSLYQIEKRFILEKFDRKLNAKEWMTRFEKECERNKIGTDVRKIEALRFFLSGTANDWYESNLTKIGIQDWVKWKESFNLIFINKGWSQVRKALSYKWLGGSLIDYAIIKERLCLDVNPGGDEISRINQVVIGLPLEAQEELDREDMTTTAILFTELRKLEDSYSKKKREIPQTQNPMNSRKATFSKLSEKYEDQRKRNETQRKPCFMCEALGFPNRWHPTTECHNKEKYSTKLRTNLLEPGTEMAETGITNLN
jgi:hypothetical protein